MWPRSYLFVPANRPDRFVKAVTSGADAVIVDLEDSVADFEKRGARLSMIQAWNSLRLTASEARCRLFIRVNSSAGRVVGEDLDCCNDLRPDGLVIPKSECREPLEEITRCMTLPLYPLVETACGVQNVKEVAGATGVARLLFGTLDLMLDLDIPDDDAPLHHARGCIAIASRAAGLPTPVDGVCAEVRSMERMKFEVERARRFGFGAKLCIHPAQVNDVHELMSITKEQLVWAQAVLDVAGRSSNGVGILDGKMIDAPVIAMAKRILRM